MYVKSVWHEKGNLYGIKIQLHEPDKDNFNLDELKQELIPILGISALDCVEGEYNEEAGIIEFIVPSSRRILYRDVFNALGELRLKRI